VEFPHVKDHGVRVSHRNLKDCLDLV
jgi:hypothetical protein